MNVLGLNHYLISRRRTYVMERRKQVYCDVLGLRPGSGRVAA